MNDISSLLTNQSKINKLPLTGLWREMFYHVVYLPNGTVYTPFILFENGSAIELVTDDKKGYSYFDDIDAHCVIGTGEPLWFSEGMVNTADSYGIAAVVNQSKIDSAQIFGSITAKLQEYYDFYQPEEVDLVLAHIVHTYILGLLGKTFYLLLEGEKNTGKSSLQTLMAQLQCKGCFSGKISMASLIRKIHHFGATVNIDEFDKIHKDESRLATGILNSGMYANGTYEIVNLDNKKTRKQLQVFHTFGSKTFSANRALFDDSLLSRCVVVNTVRNRRPIKSVYGLSEGELTQFQCLRNQLFAYCLMNGKAINGEIKALQQNLAEKNQYGRRSDICATIGGILKHFGKDYEPILRYITEREHLEDEGTADNRFYLTLDFLVGRIGENSKIIEFTNVELKEHLIQELELEDEVQYQPTARSVGSLLKKHRLIERACDRERITNGPNKGRFRYRLDAIRVLELVERSSFDDLKLKIRQLKPNTPT